MRVWHQAIFQNAFLLKRNELLHPKFENPSCSFDNGIGSKTTVKRLRGTAVAVQEFTTTPINEAKTILDIPSHLCLPLLIGLRCEKQS